MAAAALVAGCAGGPDDPGSLGAVPPPAPAASAAPRPADAPRSAADVERIEAELLALGERQNAAAAGVRSRSIVEEMKALRRRQAAEVERELGRGPVR